MNKTTPLIIFFALMLGACGSDSPNEDNALVTCAGADDCAEGFCVDKFCRAGPDDDDGISYDDELALGTDPSNADSDFDGVSDLEEVGDGAQPSDSDSDGLIDAIESEILDADNDGSVDSEDPDIVAQLVSLRAYPFAILNDGVDAARIEARLQAVEASSVNLTVGFFAKDTGFGTTQTFELIDDGTSGDRIPDDGIFSLDGVTAAVATTTASGAIGRMIFINVQFSTPEGDSVIDVSEALGGAFLGVVDAASVVGTGGVEVEPQKTTNVVVINDASLEQHFRRWMRRSGPAENTPSVVGRRFYEHFKDDFDFLALFTAGSEVQGIAGRSVGVSSGVSGLGVEPYDVSSGYGSEGRLPQALGVSFAEIPPVLHELGHRWMNHLKGDLANELAHWGYSSVNGIMGGFEGSDITDNEDGSYSFTNEFSPHSSREVPYAPLELYAMGLVGPEFVAPIELLEDAEITGSGEITASAKTTVTIEDIIESNGPRTPAVGDSQKAFTAAFAIVSDRALTDAEVSFFHHQVLEVCDSELLGEGAFTKATGSRATLDCSLVGHELN